MKSSHPLTILSAAAAALALSSCNPDRDRGATTTDPGTAPVEPTPASPPPGTTSVPGSAAAPGTTANPALTPQGQGTAPQDENAIQVPEAELTDPAQ
jgi:hypothetical protein